MVHPEGLDTDITLQFECALISKQEIIAVFIKYS